MVFILYLFCVCYKIHGSLTKTCVCVCAYCFYCKCKLYSKYPVFNGCIKL